MVYGSFFCVFSRIMSSHLWGTLPFPSNFAPIASRAFRISQNIAPMRHNSYTPAPSSYSSYPIASGSYSWGAPHVSLQRLSSHAQYSWHVSHHVTSHDFPSLIPVSIAFRVRATDQARICAFHAILWYHRQNSISQLFYAQYTKSKMNPVPTGQSAFWKPRFAFKRNGFKGNHFHFLRIICLRFSPLSRGYFRLKSSHQ